MPRKSNIPAGELAQRKKVGEKYEASQELSLTEFKIRALEYTIHMLDKRMDALIQRSEELKDVINK